MPALPDYPGVLKVRTQFVDGNDTQIATTHHFTYTGTPPGSAACDTMAGTILAAAATHLAPLLNDAASVVGVEITDLTSPTSGSGAASGSTSGTRGTDFLPAEVAVLQNYPIPRRYRGGKPRAYWPFGVSTDLVSPSEWTTAFQGAVEVATGDYFVAIVGAGTGGTTIVQLVCISYYEGFTAVTNPITGRTRDVPKVRSVAITPDVPIGIPVNLKPGSQRRRSLHSS